MKVTTRPARRARRRTAPGTRRSGAPAGARSTMLMCSRTDSCSRVIRWCWCRLARVQRSRARRRAGRRRPRRGSRARDASSTATCARRKSRPSSGSASSLARGQLHLLVFEQPAHQLGARILGLGAVGALLRRQQHARLDLDQHRRHQQVFGGELEIACADLLDVVEVLARHVRHRDVEDVEVLLRIRYSSRSSGPSNASRKTSSASGGM